MTLYLVRHATAGVRWHGNPVDHERPLDDHGRAQAELISTALAAVALDRILSSPALRCTQTVAPLAAAHGLEVESCPELFEGTAPSTAIEFVRSFVGEDVVLCSHGDLIPDVLRRLEVGGTRLEGRGCAKGSVWTLDNSTERVESGTYAETTPATI